MLVLYVNTQNIKYLDIAKRYILDTNQLVVFFPELLLNANQQRSIEDILNNLNYQNNIIIKTDSPFVIQAASNDINHKTIYI